MKDNPIQEETNAATPLMLDQNKTSLPEVASIDFFLFLFDAGNISSGNSGKAYAAEGSSEGIFKHLKANPQTGIDMHLDTDLEWRRTTWGVNAEITQEVYGFWHFVWDSLQDQMLQILLLAALVSLVIGIIQEGWQTGWIEGLTIFLAVFVVVSISSYINFSKDQQFHDLNTENNKKSVGVKRNNEEDFADVYSLVVGDVLQLNIGDIIPVDGILTKGMVWIDESNITGESNHVKKTANVIEDKHSHKKSSTPFVISGTKVQDGSGEMVVCAVGENSINGRLMSMATGDDDAKTPLQEKLEDLADQIGIIGSIGAGMIGIVLIAKDIILKLVRGESIFVQSTIDAILNAFIIAVVVIVVAIPEGLPMAVTISLAYSVKKMNDEHNLVKNLNAAETMGNVK